MAIYYSIRITMEDPGPLDGVTPLDMSMVRRTRAGVIEVTIPAGTSLGLIDPGALSGAQGADFYVPTLSVLSENAPVHAAGSVVQVQGPPAGASIYQKLLQSLAGEVGILQNFSQIIPVDHLLQLDTTADGGAPGPHSIELTLVSLDAGNAGIAAQVALAQAQQGLVGGGDLLYSPGVAAADGTFPLSPGIIQRYDPTAAAPDGIVLQFPAAPVLDQRLGVIEVGNSAVSVLYDGNGTPIMAPGQAPAATHSVATALVSVIYQFDGSVWRII